MKKVCEFCNKEFEKSKKVCLSQWEKRRFCSKSCAHSGKNAPGWKGGITKIIPNCIDCGKKVSEYRHIRCHSCNSKFYSAGKKNGNWKGGMMIDGQGYKYVYNPSHPNAINGRYVYEHRLVMEKHLGRYLETGEEIHHINGDKLDNRIENLDILSKSKHHKKHYNEREINKKGQFLPKTK